MTYRPRKHLQIATPLRPPQPETRHLNARRRLLLLHGRSNSRSPSQFALPPRILPLLQLPCLAHLARSTSPRWLLLHHSFVHPPPFLLLYHQHPSPVPSASLGDPSPARRRRARRGWESRLERERCSILESGEALRKVQMTRRRIWGDGRQVVQNGRGSMEGFRASGRREMKIDRSEGCAVML
ncbi:hypothetical protein BCR35DRAFT_106078 [Leucosporidium creatinivorum]|uniref:Uncharacterized protein n=1 Tax=Leucosporidium creatinivorum TaxID=106004 RepID=A0A1Y2G350_9BASI|nr:hypothetical protein BCR35DRAFT_106078 [Leucosporidium creatinivorum]